MRSKPQIKRKGVERIGNQNVYAVLAAGFPNEAPERCAIEVVRPGTSSLYYSWDDIDSATGKLANLLVSLDLEQGARIAVQVEKSAEALLLYLACLRAGYVYLPLNNAYRAGEVAYFIEDAEPEVFVSTGAARPDQHSVTHHFTLGTDRTGSLLEAAATRSSRFKTVARRNDDIAAILYTSGTTGRSKGAMLTHGNLSSNARTLDLYWRWRRGDVLLHALPIFHVHGLFVAVHGALLSGNRMIWLDRFNPEAVLDALPRASVFMGVPTMYVRLLDQPAFDAERCAGMRLFVSGSAPLLEDTARRFEQRTGQRILERYGMSETVMLTSNPYDGNRRPGTVGLPLPGVAVRIIGSDAASPAIGEIEVKGPGVFSGYWRMPQKTREAFTDDGYFRTGDLGQWDSNGYLSIVGRSKDLIISGGYNVYPKEIESYLDAVPGVAESAVFGLADRDFGESVAAAVVAAEGTRLDPAEIIALLKAQIAGFKVPRLVRIVGRLPRNQMGKVQKALLREQFSAAADSSL